MLLDQPNQPDITHMLLDQPNQPDTTHTLLVQPNQPVTAHTLVVKRLTGATKEDTGKRGATPEVTHQRPTEATPTEVELMEETLTADVIRACKFAVLICLFSNKL